LDGNSPRNDQHEHSIHLRIMHPRFHCRRTRFRSRAAPRSTLQHHCGDITTMQSNSKFNAQ